MNIFDILNTTKENEPTYDVNDRVRIKNVKELVKPDAETVAYLIDYGHGGQIGTIREVHKCRRAISYKVEHPKGIAWVTEQELAFIS